MNILFGSSFLTQLKVSLLQWQAEQTQPTDEDCVIQLKAFQGVFKGMNELPS